MGIVLGYISFFSQTRNLHSRLTGDIALGLGLTTGISSTIAYDPD